MAKNNGYTSSLLREKLGATLDALLDKQNPMELDRAKAVADVAQVMINIAKVEVDHMKISGGAGTGFIVERLPSASEISGREITNQLMAGSSESQDVSDLDGLYRNEYTGGTTYKGEGVTIHKGSKY